MKKLKNSVNRIKYIFFLFLFIKCDGSKLNKNFDSCDEIYYLMEDQEKSWNSGNIDDFMIPYWKNDSLIFLGKSGVNYGWEKINNNYKNNYKNTIEMGRLEFNNLICKSLNDTTHIVTGKWSIYRLDSSKNIGGYYTLIWIKKDKDWKIIYDHTS